MADFRQPPLDYLVQELESERVAREQKINAAYRRPMLDPMMPAVEAEGSWINSRHNPKN